MVMAMVVLMGQDARWRYKLLLVVMVVITRERMNGGK